MSQHREQDSSGLKKPYFSPVSPLVCALMWLCVKQTKVLGGRTVLIGTALVVGHVALLLCGGLTLSECQVPFKLIYPPPQLDKGRKKIRQKYMTKKK